VKKELSNELLDVREVLEVFKKELIMSQRFVGDSNKCKGVELSILLIKNLPCVIEPSFVYKHVIVDVLWSMARMARKNRMGMLDAGVTKCWMIVDEMKGVEMNG
jgi:hypothetical protein